MKRTKQPNVVFLLSDDQGAWATGYAGNKWIQTPTLDQLAQTGMSFDNSFCVSPVCSSARASLMTGMIPSQHGVLDWIHINDGDSVAIDYLENQLTLPEILHQNGYACAISGKWHLGDVRRVEKRFPEHCFVHQKGYGSYYNAPMLQNGVFTNEPGYITYGITEDAIGYLRQAAREERPFFLYVAYTAPHTPWTNCEHPKEYIDQYKDCPFDDIPLDYAHEDAIYRYSPEIARQCRIGYYAAITAMDHNIGRIVETLDHMGLRENTLLLFSSDNGFNDGQHGIWGKGNGTRFFNMFDTTVKVPFLANQPGVVPAGVLCHELVSQYDYLPTILEYCGIPNPLHPWNTPGKSFSSLLLGKETERCDALAVFSEYGPCRMVRTKEWKYVHRYHVEKEELYSLVADPNENINMFGDADTTAVLHELRALLEEWFARYVDPVFDGSKQPVKGNGQINAVNRLKPGELAFDQNRRSIANPVADSSVRL